MKMILKKTQPFYNYLKERESGKVWGVDISDCLVSLSF
jgi:hypothetical protein